MLLGHISSSYISNKADIFISTGLLPLFSRQGGAGYFLACSNTNTGHHKVRHYTPLISPQEAKSLKLFLLVGLDLSMAIYRGRRVRGESRYVVVWKSRVEFSKKGSQHCQMVQKVKKNVYQERATGFVDEK